MSRLIFKSIAVVAAGVLVAACTMKSQEAPPLGGPSEFGQSVTVAVNPDSLAATPARYRAAFDIQAGAIVRPHAQASSGYLARCAVSLIGSSE